MGNIQVQIADIYIVTYFLFILFFYKSIALTKRCLFTQLLDFTDY